MHGTAELEIMYMLVIAIGFLVAWIVPTLIVFRCRSRDNASEGAICQRVVQYSNNYPVRMISLETVPALLILVLGFLLEVLNLLLQFLAFILVIFNGVRIVVSWRKNKYEE